MAYATIQDHRRTFRFWLDDILFDTYGSDLGPFAIAVYAYLARKAKTRASFPAHKTIAEFTGMSRRSVIRALQKLQDANLIAIENRQNEVGDKDTNRYIIQDLSHLHTKTHEEVGSAPQAQPSAPQAQGVVPHRHKGSAPQAHKGSSLKDSQLKDKKTPLPPTGETSRKRSRQKTLPTIEDVEVLAYLNTTHTRQFTDTTQIHTLLSTHGKAVSDCKLVIDWLFAVERVENPDGYERYMNNVTPFRPLNFDRYLDRARRWAERSIAQPALPSQPYAIDTISGEKIIKREMVL